MKRSPSTTWPQEAEKKWKQEGSLQIEQSKRPGRSVDVKDEAIKKFIELANNITDEDSIEIAEEKFGIRRCLDQIFDREYVLGSDGEFEFKLKHVLLRFDLKSALDPNELLDLRIKGNAKKRATLIYLMFGPVAKVGIKAAAKESGTGASLVWTMWREPCESLEASEDFKELAEFLSKLHKNGHLEFAVMEALLTDLTSSDPRDPWSDQSIAQLLFFMSKKSRNWYLGKKQNGNSILSSAEVPGILAHLIFTTAHLKVEANDIYDTITECVSRIADDEENKKTFMKSLWHELVNHLRDVSGFTGPQLKYKTLAMKAVSEFGKFLMNKAFNEDEEEMEVEE